MKENTKTLLTLAGVTALLAFAALVYHLYPGIIAATGLDGHDLGGGVQAAAHGGAGAPGARSFHRAGAVAGAGCVFHFLSPGLPARQAAA
ncbi:MAG: hypothetical protein MUF02_09465 [Acidobacteria bacterium]|nr:hypothetical protein [Acidobacteriota bacterium]